MRSLSEQINANEQKISHLSRVSSVNSLSGSINLLKEWMKKRKKLRANFRETSFFYMLYNSFRLNHQQTNQMVKYHFYYSKIQRYWPNSQKLKICKNSKKMGDQNFLDQFVSLYDNKTTINICSTGSPVRKKTITTEISSHYHNFVGTGILPSK